MKNSILLLFLLISVLGLSKLNAAESSPQFIKGADTLVVYKDVPSLTPSDKYTIRVKSAATNNEWVDVFAHYCYNRGSEYPDIPDRNGKDAATIRMAYSVFTDGWSHSYGNIELNNGQAVEVEIASKDTSKFKIGGKNFFKATVHPAQKASAATVVNGKVYFTISKPAQIVIDINGQMDDYDAAVSGGIGHPVHAISLWANPVIKKPTLTGSRVRTIEPGTSWESVNSIDPATYDTMYFKPGVHDLKRSILVHTGKAVYIPGDALIYGTFTNSGVPVPPPYTQSGENIKIYGYGTLSGTKIPHYLYSYYFPDLGGGGSFKPIVIENGLNASVYGVTLSDDADHAINIDGQIKWVKVFSWRTNGDGLSIYGLVEDCFIRTQDDASYMKGSRRRCTFWKDTHAAMFHMAVIPENGTNPLIIEDCDVIYARLREFGTALGGVFMQRSEGTSGQRPVNVLVRNFRIHDTRLGMSVFFLKSDGGGSSYKGIVFQNISMPATTVKQRMFGSATAPWDGGITFDNITIGGVLLTEQNFLTHFTTNEYVKNLIFKAPGDDTIFHNIALSASIGGTVSGGGTFNLKTYVTVTAVSASGFGFVNWTENGVPVSTSRTYTFLVTKNSDLVANFVEISTISNIKTPSGWVAGTTNNKVDGSNRMMVVMASGENSATAFSATGITYGGQPMTKQIDSCYAVAPPAGAFTYTSIFTLNEAGVNAATSGEIVVTWSTTPSAGSDVQSVLLTNVDQNKPIYAVAKGAASARTVSTNVMTVTSGDMIIMSGANYNSVAITFNNGFTKRLESNSTWGDAICGEKVVIDASETPSFTQSNSGRVVACAIAVKQTPSTSINNVVTKNDFSIYPNPATDKLFFNSANKQISKIELLDLTGKIVYSANLQLQNGSVDLKGIAKGLYLVKIHADNTILTKKISIK